MQQHNFRQRERRVASVVFPPRHPGCGASTARSLPTTRSGARIVPAPLPSVAWEPAEANPDTAAATAKLNTDPEGARTEPAAAHPARFSTGPASGQAAQACSLPRAHSGPSRRRRCYVRARAAKIAARRPRRRQQAAGLGHPAQARVRSLRGPVRAAAGCASSPSSPNPSPCERFLSRWAWTPSPSGRPPRQGDFGWCDPP